MVLMKILLTESNDDELGLEDSYEDNDEVTHDEEDVGNGADDKDDLHHAQYDQSH